MKRLGSGKGKVNVISRRVVAAVLVALLLLGGGFSEGAGPLSPVTAEAATASVKLNYSSLTLPTGGAIKLKLKNATGTPTWTSSKKSVAKVNKNGKVTGKKAGTATITATLGGETYTCSVTVKSYAAALTGSVKADQKLYAVIKSNITSSMSKAEKIKAIHDWIVLNCAYDYDNYLNNTLPASSYAAEGVLLDGTAVCQGYALAFKAFMDALGINCKTVTGTGNGGGHMWNMVKIGGKWYNIDVTWDDPVPDTAGYVRYSYFLVNDKVLSKDHSWNTSSYPSCTASSNKFISLLGTVCTTEAELKASFLQQKADGVTNYSAIVPKDSSLDVTGIFMSALSKKSCNYRFYTYGKYTVYGELY